MTPAPDSCGSCTLCCKVLGVEELRKPADRWCRHCAQGEGCTIYDDLPPSCREFLCMWLDSQQLGTPLAAALKPSRSHVVISTSKTGEAMQLHVDPGYPDAWRKPIVQDLIRGMVRHGFMVLVGIGRQRIAVDKTGIRADFMEDAEGVTLDLDSN